MMLLCLMPQIPHMGDLKGPYKGISKFCFGILQNSGIKVDQRA